MKGEAYRTLTNKVREFEVSTLLRTIALVGALKLREPNLVERAMSRFMPDPRAALPDFALAEMAKISISLDDDPHYRRDKIVTDRDLAYLQSLYIAVDEPDLTDWSDVETYLFRLGGLQFRSQGSVWQLIPRSLLIHAYEPPTLASGFNARERFKDALGMDLMDFTFLGASLFALGVATKDGLLHTEALDQVRLPQHRRQLIERFLDHTCVDFESFRRICESECHPEPGLEPYDYNPLVERPIVRLPSGDLVLPIPRLLIERTTSGIYYDLAGEYGNEFLEYLGHAFEGYVGRLLSSISGTEASGEQEYGPRKRRRRSCDWTANRGDDTLIVECKTKRLRIGSRLPSKQDDLKDDLRKGIVPAVRQLTRCVADIKLGLIFPNLRGTRLHPIIATLDSPYLFNCNPIRSMVTNQLREQGSEVIDYQVVGVDELEFLTAAPQPDAVFEVIRKKFDDEAVNEHDLSTLIRDEIGFHPHPMLRAVYQTFLGDIGLPRDQGASES